MTTNVFHTVNSVGPVTDDCPSACGNRNGLVLRGNYEGWVPPDFDPNTGRSATFTQERCPVCSLYTIWRRKVTP